MRWILVCCSFALFTATATTADAADVWSDPAPGIRQLVRTVAGPIRYVAITIDLSRPEYFLRVTRPDERALSRCAFVSSRKRARRRERVAKRGIYSSSTIS